MTTEGQYTKQRWAYAGRREGTKKPADVFYVLSADGKPERRLAFEMSKGSRTIAGVYEVEVSPDGTKARIPSARFVGMLQGCDEHVLSWKAEHDAYEMERDARALEISGKELHLELLAPIRKLYHSMPAMRQAAVEVAVLRYLRRRA